MQNTSNLYKRAFTHYLRTGTPIYLFYKKEGRATTHYIWRTRGDGKARDSHAKNDGKIFAWDNPPPTGHPGEDYGCRCTAEPYYPEINENIQHTLDNSHNFGPRWGNTDFVWHFYTGNGKEVTLREIGHLRAIAQHWAYEVDGTGRLEAWTQQILSEARKVKNGIVTKKFNRPYHFGDVSFSHGSATVRGAFRGTASIKRGALIVQGETEYEFSDAFTDPINLREFRAWLLERPDRVERFIRTIGARIGIGSVAQGEPLELNPDNVSDLLIAITDIGGTAYRITGRWKSTLKAHIQP